MRLRYLRVSKLPPLQDAAIVFNHERVLGRECAIHFIVGVNGSGKTRLLRALAETFLCLEKQTLPPFAVSLAFDLGRGDSGRTLLLHHPGQSPSEAMLVEFGELLSDRALDEWEHLSKINWRTNPSPDITVRNAYTGEDLPGSGSISAYLPSTLLVYTSGITETWTDLFSSGPEVDTNDLPPFALENRGAVERPIGWNTLKEIEHLRKSGQKDEADAVSKLRQEITTDGSSSARAGIFIQPDTLRLAACAVTLHEAANDFDIISTASARNKFLKDVDKAIADGRRMPGLRGLLNEIDWLWPLAVSVQIDFRPDELSRILRDQIAQLYRIASSVTSDPIPGTKRQLFFDLQRPDPENSQRTTARALLNILSGGDDKSLSAFRQLYAWQQDGFLKNVTLTVRKHNLPDVLQYDWLSDGEQMFLGRMALFHLLAGTDDALILLDEPETHFNDVWKREIVDIIDDGLRTNLSDVVISTHSSIALTDVFDTEVSLLRKEPDGSVAVIRTPVRTFGASPDEIMRDVFGASDTVGQRATEFLDMVLLLAAYPEQVENVWSNDDDLEKMRKSNAFGKLWSYVKTLPHTYETDERLLTVLQSLRAFARTATGQQEVKVIDAVSALQDRLGAGYYQFEFRRRLRALGERRNNATPD